jgi:hypothetical protein
MRGLSLNTLFSLGLTGVPVIAIIIPLLLCSLKVVSYFTQFYKSTTRVFSYGMPVNMIAIGVIWDGQVFSEPVPAYTAKKLSKISTCNNCVDIS